MSLSKIAFDECIKILFPVVTEYIGRRTGSGEN
jgi:hypothetical protein